VAFLDLGGVGYIDDATRERATDLYISVIRGDPKAAAARWWPWPGRTGGHVDVPALEWALPGLHRLHAAAEGRRGRGPGP